MTSFGDIDIDSENGLLPDDTKPSPQPETNMIVPASTSVDLSSKIICGIHTGSISQEVLTNLICKMCSEITL